jgi:hypothetical protein
MTPTGIEPRRTAATKFGLFSFILTKSVDHLPQETAFFETVHRG